MNIYTFEEITDDILLSFEKGTEFYLKKEVDMLITNMKKKTTISRSVDDFETEAREMENFIQNKKTLYDRSKFQEAVELMISKHDAETEISWSTIRYYLDEYCKLK